ncbi:zeta toxin family protein [Algoriphagus persicinus]|uniref:zeta toxin family protein n=1 Tax=Algoriphagus persicinus TaxID=3108754 RepID=UPI002B38BCC3|nr:zeta toxin family protein [Algoriphagus sp. E1-3-M2]MEB2784745.1 zeta toxin family protein [Algoriphagus sp. E1-3-M2]
MAKPKLWIIAGCNGSGKSSYSKALVENGIIPFDYDAYFLKYYQTIQPSEIQDQMAHNLAYKELENQVEEAISEQKSFSYETNFDSTPLFWPKKFRDNGYEIQLIFLVLNSIEEAIRRVAVRVQNGGHFVPNNEIQRRYFQGFQNLDNHFTYFDGIDVFNTSRYEMEPSFCFSTIQAKAIYVKEFPEFLKTLIPQIHKSIIS